MLIGKLLLEIHRILAGQKDESHSALFVILTFPDSKQVHIYC